MPEEERSTPVPGPRRTPSLESASLANLGACHESLAVHLREAARDLDLEDEEGRRRLIADALDFVAQVRDLADDTVVALLALDAHRRG